MKQPGSVRFMGLAAALLVPALAAAALNLPHNFMTGEVLTAAKLNDNFNAVKREVEALQTTTTQLGASPLRGCRWYWQACATAPGVECQLICPGGFYAVSGGCDAVAGESVSENRPSTANPTFPPTGSPITSFDRWTCEGNGPDSLTAAYALCCPQSP